MYDDADVRKKVISVFQKFRGFIDAEIQQRANEYFMLAGNSDEALMVNIYPNLPTYFQTKIKLILPPLNLHNQYIYIYSYYVCIYVPQSISL